MAAAALSAGPAQVRELMRRAEPPARRDSDSEPLRCFQVAGPVLAPTGLLVGNETVGRAPREYTSCETYIVEHHVFSNSYGHPYVGE